MLTHQRSFDVHTPGRGFTDISSEVRVSVTKSGVVTGLAHVFIHHTSASLLIAENADHAVLRDLGAFLARLVPDGDPIFRHTAEGPDDMPAHLRSVLTTSSLVVPVTRGRLALGSWQGIFCAEHRLDPHKRRVTVTVQGSVEAT
jgi:secondary thiamine-phosphate synthase enzyme